MQIATDIIQRLREAMPLDLTKDCQFFILDVTGKKQAYFTFWSCTSIPGVCRHYNYIKNVSVSFDKAAEFCLNWQETSGRPVTIFSDTTTKIKTLAKDGVLTFGKYSGMHMLEVAEKDLNYVVWLSKAAHKFAVQDLARKVADYVKNKNTVPA